MTIAAMNLQGPFRMEAWEVSYQLTLEVYRVTATFPKHEQFGITSQLRRGSSSIAANITEGFGRYSTKSKIHFYNMAFASLMEVQLFLQLSRDLTYLAPEMFDELMQRIMLLQKKLNSIQKVLRAQL